MIIFNLAKIYLKITAPISQKKKRKKQFLVSFHLVGVAKKSTIIDMIKHAHFI